MRKILPLLGLLFLLAACAPAPGWDSFTLRALDPSDAPDPTADLTALYTRQRGLMTEIRLDLLDIPFDPTRQDTDQPPLPDLYIALDTQPGGFIAWAYPKSQTAAFTPSDLEYDLLIAIPGRGSPAVYAATEAGLREEGWRFPSVSVDRTADTLTVRYLSPGLPAGARLQAITLNSIPLDQTPVIRTADQPGISAPVLLLFYDVFPAATPTQALRRWDGAHSGPYGERHGLKHLLQAAERYNLPITLLGLAAPERLSALDYAGGTALLNRLTQQNLIHLSDWPPGTAWPAPDESDALQPTADGLSLEARRTLLNAALNGQPLVWGGELAYGAWANADAAAPSMAYLSARPYIHVLPPAQFMDLLPSGQWEVLGLPAGLDAPEAAANVAGIPAKSPLQSAAQGMLTHLTSPSRDPQLRQLRTRYLPDLAYFAAAARWEQSPAPLTDCETLPDTCLLANEVLFAVLRTDGARLAYLFLKDETGLHQIVAPTYQFMTGISDRTQWQFNQGQGADPGALGGAFVDADAPWADCAVQIEPDESITFTCAEGARRKTFSLQGEGLRVRYEGITPPTTRIGLALDPWRRFAPDWGSLYGGMANGGWGVQGGPSVRIEAAGDVIRASFLDSRERMGSVEDPNFEYPPGHFLPFPMAVYTVPEPVEVTLQVR